MFNIFLLCFGRSVFFSHFVSNHIVFFSFVFVCRSLFCTVVAVFLLVLSAGGLTNIRCRHKGQNRDTNRLKKKCRYHVQLVFNLIFFFDFVFSLRRRRRRCLPILFAVFVRVVVLALCVFLMRSTQNYTPAIVVVCLSSVNSLIRNCTVCASTLETDVRKFSD